MSKSRKKHDVYFNEGAIKLASSSLRSNIFEHGSFYYLALLLLLYVAVPSFMLSVFLLLNAGSPSSAYWLSIAVLSVVVYYNRNKLSVKDYIVLLCVLLICHIYAYFGFDGSYDGFTYQQPVVRRIANGFNPVYDGYMSLGRPFDHWSDQVTYFPKAIWYFSAAVTAAFGDIQIGKAYNLILMMAALFFVLDSTKKEHIIKRVLWVVACLNPIALTQMHHYLVDGALSSLFTISLFYAYLFFNSKPISRFQHFFCIVALSMLFCVKTSGFGYGSIKIRMKIQHHQIIIAHSSQKQGRIHFLSKQWAHRFKFQLRRPIQHGAHFIK